MIKRKMTWMLAVSLLSVGAVACGDDDTSSDSDTTEADAGDSGDAGDTGGLSAEVQDFCDKAAALAEDLKKVMADPTSGDVTALTAKASELTAAAAQLSSSNADEVDDINKCSQVLTDAVGG